MSKRDILKEIIQKKKEKILLAKQTFPEEELKERVKQAPDCRPFIEAINKPRQISLIAEIKKASPSKGIIRQDFDLQRICEAYRQADVQAISVLTERDYFGGDLSFINEVKKIVEKPVLRKDFILEPYQIYESRFFGADAVLLIAEALTKDSLSELIELCDSLGLDYIVEAHAQKELKKIIGMKVPVIGINNRDLHTLEVDFKTTEKLFPLIPKDKIVIVESGIKKHQDVLFLKILGVNAVLIGEAFMEAENITARVEEIMGW
ncbi:MAG: indole-3-glycerol phosphate synthase TrpC [Candidatus Omnitrophota bacterium]